MKKSLLALAVLGTFAGAASAQSSVTLFGIVDLGVRYLDNGGTKQYQMENDGNASSRLGFRGVEDLGGGLNASFWIEGAMTPQNGTNAYLGWQRRSTVSLSGGWGEVRLGRDYVATFWNAAQFDPFGYNGVGSVANFLAGPMATPPGGAWITTVRDNNMVAYFLPSGIAGGLYGQAQVGAGQNMPGQKYYGLRLGYASGPFNVAGAWARNGVGGAGDDNGTDWNAAASWDFGVVKASGYFGKRNLENLDQRNWFVALQAPIGLWTLKGMYGEVKRGGNEPTWASAAGWDDQKAKQIAVGATYDLSKRTALYGTYSHINNSGGAAFTVAGLTGAGPGMAVNENSQAVEFGIRHSF